MVCLYKCLTTARDTRQGATMKLWAGLRVVTWRRSVLGECKKCVGGNDKTPLACCAARWAGGVGMVGSLAHCERGLKEVKLI